MRTRAPSRQVAAETPEAPLPLVKLSGLKKAFGKRTVVEKVDLAIEQGELIEVTGPSGSGKTTMLRLIHGQLRPTAGEVWIRGQAVHRRWRRDLDRVRRDVGYIFQEQRLLPRLTALENVIVGLTVNDPAVPHAAIKRRALAALESVGVAHRRDAFPSQLSAGERQRVAVARALVTRPKVLLADEPFNSIDRENARVVAQMLEEAASQGTAVVVATHHPTGRAARVVAMPGGSVTEATAGLRRLLEASVPVSVAVGATNGNGASHKAQAHKKGRARRPSRAARWWRTGSALFANSFRLVLLGGLRSWRRDLRFTLPAMQTMSLLLVMCGLLGLVFAALVPAAGRAAADASMVRIYLAPAATNDQVYDLEQRLRADPRVASVSYVSADQALQEASADPGLSSLAGLTDSNPFPAGLDVRVRLVTEVSAVARLAQDDPAVDRSYPTSYDPTLYHRLWNLAIGVGVVGGALVLGLAFVAYAVAANGMRAIAAARREEVTTLRLLGARPWMLRDPFIIEGLMTGALAGAVAAALVGGAWYAAWEFTRNTFVLLLPGVGLTPMRYVTAGVIVAGIVLGVLTSLLSFRRVRA